MGEAKRRKKLDPNYGKKRLTNLNEEENDLEIAILEGRGTEYERYFHPLSPDVIDCLYLQVAHGPIRAIVRLDIYESWVNPDLSVETINEMESAIWRTDGLEDEKGKRKWLERYENTIRDYGTDSWLKLRCEKKGLDIIEFLNKQTGRNLKILS